MLRRSFPNKPKPERQPIAWPGKQQFSKSARCDGVEVARPKDAPVRSEAYRRLVAALPCAHCGIQGLSQAAHPPALGRGIKADDRLCFPMCCARPDVAGCHFLFDQNKLYERRMMRYWSGVWSRQTQEIIIENGMWPKGLERPR